MAEYNYYDFEEDALQQNYAAVFASSADELEDNATKSIRKLRRTSTPVLWSSPPEHTAIPDDVEMEKVP